MARGSHCDRLELWSGRLRSYAQSHLTVVEFCRHDGVSMPSFYQWKRRIGSSNGRECDRLSLRLNDASGMPAFRAITVAPAGSAMTVRLPKGIE